MNAKAITADHVSSYAQHLRAQERASGTVEKYCRDVRAFAAFLCGSPATLEVLSAWKLHLRDHGYAPVTINSMLAAVTGFLHFHGWTDGRPRYLKVQRRLFRDPGRELDHVDYRRLLSAAATDTRLSLLIETIASTGIRVSEVRYLTLEALKRGKVEIALKGKIRTILLPAKLMRKLQKYARQKKIASGEIFLTRSGRPLSRHQIWAELKALCKRTDVDPTKVFPHNLRHLFARTFYKASGDIARLADVLGHSSIETTRIYLLTTAAEHIRQIENLGLVT